MNKQSVSVISQAVNELRNSKTFVRYLEVVLKVGNMINTGSFRGGAYGFKLDTLNKVAPIMAFKFYRRLTYMFIFQLADVRTSNKDIPTLLHYIAAKADSEWPELNDLHKDFEALPQACRGTWILIF